MSAIGWNGAERFIFSSREETIREIVHLKILTYPLDIDADLTASTTGDQRLFIRVTCIEPNVIL